jgi:hypothetical protein
MSLQTIDNDMLPWKSCSKQLPRIDDPKSHPFYHYKCFGPRVPPTVGNSGRPRVWYPSSQFNRPVDLSLTTDDIEGSRPRVLSFVTKRSTNPLSPEYTLPSHQALPAVHPPSLKGALPTNYISDIDGTHPRLLHRERSRTQSCESSSRNMRRPRGGGVSSLDVRDINTPSPSRLCPRNTNPLDPSYVISATNHLAVESASSLSPITIGPIKDSKPRRRVPERFNAVRESIEGCSPQRYVGTLRHSSLDSVPPLTHAAPITGTVSGSLRRGFVSKRSTNPLEPAYTLLDGTIDIHDAILGC